MKKTQLHMNVEGKNQTFVRRNIMKNRIASIIITGLAAVAIVGAGILSPMATETHADNAGAATINLMEYPLPWDTAEATLELERLGFFEDQTTAAYREASERGVNSFPGSWDDAENSLSGDGGRGEASDSDVTDIYRTKMESIHLFPGSWDEGDGDTVLKSGKPTSPGPNVMEVYRVKMESVNLFPGSWDDSEVTNR